MAAADPKAISPAPVALQPCARSLAGSRAATAYRALTGSDSADAWIDSDKAFDRHVLASILAAAMTESGSVAERTGLEANDLVMLVAKVFPHISVLFDVLAGSSPGDHVEEEETAMVRDLLLAQRSSCGDVGRWLAAMVARRAMEPNHLWEDLGLRDRSELTRLLTRHFAPLALGNTKNMRWKRYFYRKLCEDDGVVMCSTPVCANCGDFNECFGDESGESRMADRRRQMDLRASTLAS